mmetsp:Transcript_43066/g.91436  ORF Transcript_43066/g.91436 Transcript_43066/m.91436 type:complete len:324 (+) Transcript_43066:46-1017(+)|eukprot:CAMPEP_0204271366 /NCGR_PEP_ID=MMETSP0468-20130131/19679_1 /ASSEMBLY_ACC=CAM_ASM_000383 /TAXON_ID=2969 /ORGANISM="Oxyrrhis marina" /LENGTH=323 /DNA_ID=CAMNT_0051247029 /DNA_START=41 /DNA_END=1012 /DNA_ORIENTATION=+
MSFKVCVCGGAGGIGQPLCLLMAMDPRVAELSIQDVAQAMVPAAGVAADLSHLNTACKVKGYAIDTAKPPKEQLEECLKGCHLVLVPAGMPRKPGMTRDDLFNINAGIAKGIAEACAEFCPNAVLALIVNPVNSVVPAIAELYKKWGKDPKKVVGVTTLDCVRASKFVAESAGGNAADIQVPIIGGHAGATIMPVLSQTTPKVDLKQDQVESLDKRIQDAGTEVVEAKNGKGSATLSMAYAGARLGKAVLTGLAGGRATEYAYVQSSVTDLPYFASNVVFGTNGVQEVLDIGELSEYEKGRLEEAKTQLKAEIEKGVEYAASN